VCGVVRYLRLAQEAYLTKTADLGPLFYFLSFLKNFQKTP
jgi:hypothetical protein